MSKTFNPLWPSTLGFDQVFKDLDKILESSNSSQFPPHNIIKVDDYNYIIELAVAGFTKNDISIKRIDNTIEIRGNKNTIDVETNYLHKGIGTRSFVKIIRLADTVEVVGSEMKDGILRIAFENVIPEKKRPVEIEIQESIPNRSKRQLLTE